MACTYTLYLFLSVPEDAADSDMHYGGDLHTQKHKHVFMCDVLITC